MPSCHAIHTSSAINWACSRSPSTPSNWTCAFRWDVTALTFLIRSRQLCFMLIISSSLCMASLSVKIDAKWGWPLQLREAKCLRLGLKILERGSCSAGNASGNSNLSPVLLLPPWIARCVELLVSHPLHADRQHAAAVWVTIGSSVCTLSTASSFLPLMTSSFPFLISCFWIIVLPQIFLLVLPFIALCCLNAFFFLIYSQALPL